MATAKFTPRLTMSRKDVEIDHKQVKCLNLEVTTGYSQYVLKPGMFFKYRDGDTVRLARMHHHLVKTIGAYSPSKNQIVAQVMIGSFGENHCERWIDPIDVIETRPAENMPPEIVALFDRLVSMWDTHAFS